MSLVQSASNPRIDVREEVATAPLSRFHVLLAALISLIVFFDGYDTFNASYVIHYAVRPWRLNPSQAGLLVSSGLFGFMVGAMLQGRLSDRYGRRKSLLLALWVATVFSFATAQFAHSFVTFCVLQFCAGIGLGTLLPLGVTYMNEFAPRKYLNSFSMWGWTLGLNMGGLMASVVGALLTPRFGWPILYYLGSLSIFLAIACHFVLPESIKFSAIQGDHAAVADLLGKLIPGNRSKYREPGATFFFPEPNDRAASVSLLLTAENRRKTLFIWAAAFSILFAIYGLTGWVPSAMMRRGESFTASFGYGALIQGLGFLGALACGYFADRRSNSRLAMCCWWSCGAVAVGILGFANGHYLNMACVAASGFFIMGGQGVLNNYTANSAPTEVRATAVGMMLGVGRMGAVLGPFVLGLIQQAFPNPFTLFLALAIACLAGLTMIALIRPGKTLGSAETTSPPIMET
jgi:MFS transporter, AAHS family, 4-hydroxybenzoate transporter